MLSRLLSCVSVYLIVCITTGNERIARWSTGNKMNIFTSSEGMWIMQMAASAAGIGGAALMALRIGAPRTAYTVWIAGNLLFIPYCLLSSQWGILGMNLAFLALNVAGLVKWKSEQDPAIRADAPDGPAQHQPDSETIDPVVHPHVHPLRRIAS